MKLDKWKIVQFSLKTFPVVRKYLVYKAPKSKTESGVYHQNFTEKNTFKIIEAL